MSSLRNAMQQHLHQWRDRLPSAWQEVLDSVAPNLDAIRGGAELARDARIVPAQDGVFYALDGIDPADVRVVVVGNDPYPHPHQATGRSFEQGDLTGWISDLPACRVTRSLLTLACAAASLCPNAGAFGLDGRNLHQRKETLRRALQHNVSILPPQSMFEYLTGQGVLWINRTPTISVFQADDGWEDIKEHRRWHRALWRPVTRKLISCLVEEALERTIVFALFGREAKGLKNWIKATGRRLCVPSENLHVVESGHPCLPHRFFCSGNPLQRINDKLTEPIDWCGPTAWPTAANGLSSTTTGRPGHMRQPLRTNGIERRASLAIMDRAVGKYRTALTRLADQ